MADMISKMETEISNPVTFIFGGKSEFTIENTFSHNGFKYRVNRCNSNDKMFFVNVRDGAGEWVYAGFLTKNGDTVDYVRGRRGAYDKFSAPIKGLFYAIKNNNHPLPRPMLMTHHGKCCCCGKSLNDADSVLRGMGPVCWERVKGLVLA